MAVAEYEVACSLYTARATRGAEVRVRKDGKFYYIALEHVEGTTWTPSGEEVGPYTSEEETEAAAVNSAWFLGGK